MKNNLILWIMLLLASTIGYGQNIGINVVNPPEKLTVGGRLITNQLGLGTPPTTPKLSINGPAVFYRDRTLEFGLGAIKEINAGKIGYQTFSDGLDFVGAGTSPTNRKIKFWAEGGSYFDGNIHADLSFVTNQFNFNHFSPLDYTASRFNIDFGIDKDPFMVTQSMADAECGCGHPSSNSGFIQSGWQSFTAINTGILSYVRMNTGPINDMSIVKIYNGEGTSGSELATSNIIHTDDDWSYSGYLEVPVVAGQKYTIWVNNYSGWKYCNNAYSGGKQHFDGNDDYFFGVLLNKPQPDLIVKENGNVGIGIQNPSHKLHVNGATRASIVSANKYGINVPNALADFHINGNVLINNSITLGGSGFFDGQCHRTIFRNINDQVFQIEGSGDVANGGRRFDWQSRGGFTFTGKLVTDNLTVTNISDLDHLHINSAKPGSKSTIMKYNLIGTVVVTPGISSTKAIVIDFSGLFPFATPPKIVVTPSNSNNKTEQFVITTTDITTTSARLIVRRVDANAPWTENMEINWWAFH